MNGLGVFLIALGVCVALIIAKPLIFRALDRIAGRRHGS